MNPLKLLFTKTESGQYNLQTQDDNDVSFSEVLNMLGSLGWVIMTIVCWSKNGFFDDTLGRIAFIPVLFVAGFIGFYTTAFLIYTSLIIIIFGCLIGWVFNFSFLNSLFAFTSSIF